MHIRVSWWTLVCTSLFQHDIVFSRLYSVFLFFYASLCTGPAWVTAGSVLLKALLFLLLRQTDCEGWEFLSPEARPSLSPPGARQFLHYFSPASSERRDSLPSGLWMVNPDLIISYTEAHYRSQSVSSLITSSSCERGDSLPFLLKNNKSRYNFFKKLSKSASEPFYVFLLKTLEQSIFTPLK